MESCENLSENLRWGRTCSHIPGAHDSEHNMQRLPLSSHGGDSPDWDDYIISRRPNPFTFRSISRDCTDLIGPPRNPLVRIFSGITHK
jgi:hypothetical protein